MYSVGDSLVVVDSVFRDNFCYEEGGGIRVIGVPVVELTGCLFEGNVGDELGGGLTCWYGPSACLVDCTFRNNFANVAGGGAYITNIDSMRIEGCIFDGNETDGSGLGGGLRIKNLPSGVLHNCTVTRCFAQPEHGAGVSIGAFSNILVESCLIAYNRMGGGIGTWEYQSNCTVECSDVYGNEGGDYISDLPDQTGIAGNISEDPRFCDLDGGDFHLAADSPCLPENNDCEVLMGAQAQGCSIPTGAPAGDMPVTSRSLARIRAFPNPSRGLLKLQLSRGGEWEPCRKKLRVRIVDPTGRAIHEGSVDGAALGASGAVIDLRQRMPGLASGVYFGSVQDCRGESQAFRFHLLK